MMKKRRSHFMSLMAAFAACCITAALAQELAPGSFDLSWNTIDGGGGTSSGGTFEVTGTIGQPDASSSMLTGGTFSLSGGFWPGTATPIPTCAPDIATPHDGRVNIDDLLYVISQWGQPGGPADTNHDNIVNIDDLLAVIAAWGMCP